MKAPKRLVHLDFHTSPEIKGIGYAYDYAEQIAPYSFCGKSIHPSRSLPLLRSKGLRSKRGCLHHLTGSTARL